MKKIFLTFLLILLALFAVLVVISETKPSRQIISKNPVIAPEMAAGFEERLSKAIRCKTISHENKMQDDSIAFLTLHQWLNESFPITHKKADLLKINKYALLYIIKGNRPDLKPILLAAHQDVVPIPDSTVWQQPPFSGFNDGKYIWGRGTLDDKGSLMGILEATELLLKNDFQPQRTLILAFGCDEEINGKFGAKAISEYLEENNIRPEFVLDEGLVLTRGVVPMLNKPVGLIGIAEKGYLTLQLLVEMEGGHSSMPNKENAMTTLAQAVTKLNQHHFETSLCEPVKLFMNYVGHEMDFFPRLIFNNHWFFSPIIKKVYLGFPEGEASVRTTIAPTVFHSGMKDNVVPQTAEALVNFRLLPGETIESIQQKVAKIIDDERVVISIYGQPFDPPTPSPTSGFGFETIMCSITEEFPDAAAVPYLMLGSSDAKHYYNICNNIYRFAPYDLTGDDMNMLHGNNEKISIESYEHLIKFYYRLIWMACGEMKQ